ncbi:MAG: FHA domain-containing protein [Deltaproteobacteria bacterium]|nr:FHA domain-containing protein [Deltaproteobacteria bacterium]MBT6434466.1 FHA domain-containing protein [Deltaproteobacteria bacterium]MBT6491422.1 FHA domain-containing protein [Deltaproteobacteria bacterium]
MNNIDDLNGSFCEEHELTIDNEWMKKLEVISKRLATAKILLTNAEENSGDIKEAIFKRVQNDYQQRLAIIEDELAPVASHIRGELTQIATREKGIQGRLELIEDLIEEQKFRAKVGEYPDTELAEKVGALGTLKERLDTHLAIVSATYDSCEKFLGADWREHEHEVTPIKHSMSSEIEHGPTTDVQVSVQDSPEPESQQDSASLVWADLGTPVAPGSQGESVSEWERPSLKEALEGPSEALTVAAVSPEQVAARAELEACLEMINPKGVTERFELGEEGISIGKSTVNDVVIKKAGVSRRHARVVLRESGEYHVQDLSGSGVAVNGLMTDQSILHSGDTITVGKIDFELITRD